MMKLASHLFLPLMSLTLLATPVRAQRIGRIVKDVSRAVDSKKLKLIEHFGLTVEEVPGQGYLRVVKVAIPEDFNLLKWATKFTPVDLGAVKGGSVTFRKFYRTFEEANGVVSSLDYLRRIPLTADVAMNQFQEGEQVSFESKLIFSTGLKTLSRLGLSPAGLSGKVILTGTFLVQMKKVEGNRIELALTTTQARDRRFKGHIGSDSDFKFLEAKVNGISLRDINPQLFEYSRSQGAKKFLTFIYDIDLGQVEGQKFYNSLIQSGAVGDLEHMKDFVRNPMALVDGEIGAEMRLDSLKPIESSEAVKVTYSGLQDQNTEVNETKLFWGFSKSFKETAAKSSLTYVGEGGGEKQHYVFDKMVFEANNRRLFGYWLAEDKTTTLSLVSRSDAKGERQEFLGLSALSIFEATGSNLSTLKQWKRHFQLILPGFIHSQFWFQGWGFFNKIPGARVSLDVQFDPLFFDRVASDVVEIPDRKRYFEMKAMEYLERIGDPQISTLRACYVKTCELLRIRKNDSVSYDYLDEIKKVAGILEEYFAPDRTSEERIQSLAKLQSSALFKEVGVGFLISLIPEQQLFKYISVDFTVENYDPARAHLPTQFRIKERSIHFGREGNSVLEKAQKNERLSRGGSLKILQPQISVAPILCSRALN